MVVCIGFWSYFTEIQINLYFTLLGNDRKLLMIVFLKMTPSIVLIKVLNSPLLPCHMLFFWRSSYMIQTSWGISGKCCISSTKFAPASKFVFTHIQTDLCFTFLCNKQISHAMHDNLCARLGDRHAHNWNSDARQKYEWSDFVINAIQL